MKELLFDYYEMIGNSKCLDSAIIEYKKVIEQNFKIPEELDIKNTFTYLLRSTFFVPFFSKDKWGMTIPALNLSFINIDIIDLQRNHISYPDYIFLFYFIRYII